MCQTQQTFGIFHISLINFIYLLQYQVSYKNKIKSTKTNIHTLKSSLHSLGLKALSLNFQVFNLSFQQSPFQNRKSNYLQEMHPYFDVKSCLNNFYNYESLILYCCNDKNSFFPPHYVKSQKQCASYYKEWVVIAII